MQPAGACRTSSKNPDSKSYESCSSGNESYVTASYSRGQNGSKSIPIKPVPGFSTQTPRIHHFSKERTGPILRISKAAVKHVHDIKADIKSDQIGERQRSN